MATVTRSDTTRTITRVIAMVCLSVLLYSCDSNQTVLQPFASDGCSAFPDGTFSQPDAWQQCCYHHDKSYWPGGTRNARLLADRQLASCVVEAGFPLTAKLMYAGVRIGGTPYLPTPFRWGFGWSWFHHYEDH